MPQIVGSQVSKARCISSRIEDARPPISGPQHIPSGAVKMGSSGFLPCTSSSIRLAIVRGTGTDGIPAGRAPRRRASARALRPAAPGVPGELGGLRLHRPPRPGPQTVRVGARPVPDAHVGNPRWAPSRRCRSSSSAPSPRSSARPRRLPPSGGAAGLSRWSAVGAPARPVPTQYGRSPL